MAGFTHYLATATTALTERTLDILFPPTCARCKADGDWLCDTCLDSIRLFRHAQRGAVAPFTSSIVCSTYADQTVQTLITSLKYRSASCLKSPLKRLFVRFRNEFNAPWPWACLSSLSVTSVPASARRIRERGIDHAAIVADAVRETLVPWAERAALLKRIAHVMPNAKLPTNELRALNVKGAFAVRQNISIPVLLVDDVMTTGATAREAAQELLKAGAPSVFLLALAKGGVEEVAIAENLENA